MTELENQLLEAMGQIAADIESECDGYGPESEWGAQTQRMSLHAFNIRAAIAAAEATSLQPTVAVVPDFPGRLSIADLDYAQKLKPESWSDEHFETWQLLQVASRNVTRLHIYARQLRAMLEAAHATVKDSLIVQQALDGGRPDQFFAYSNEIGFELLNTAEDARAFAQQEIDEYRDNAAEGWDESVENVRWGVVLGKAEQIPITDHDGNTTDSSGDRFVDYVLSDCAPAQIEQQAPHKWQPIGTAPADGRTILLGHFNSHGNWRTIRGQWFTKEHIEDNWEDGDLFEAGWYETSVEADDAPSCWPTKPTYWQPLPAAPTQEAGARLAAEGVE